MTVCANFHGHTKPTLWHHKETGPVFKDGVGNAAHVCVNRLEATFMALNHTCHELVEDVDECETRDEDLTEPCNIHLKSTRQELLHAEEDIHSGYSDECPLIDPGSKKIPKVGWRVREACYHKLYEVLGEFT